LECVIYFGFLEIDSHVTSYMRLPPSFIDIDKSLETGSCIETSEQSIIHPPGSKAPFDTSFFSGVLVLGIQSLSVLGVNQIVEVSISGSYSREPTNIC
jgi:hypothetical protein